MTCAVACASAGAEPVTQPATQPSAALDAIKRSFEQLSDDDPGVRDEASTWLMQLRRDDLPALRKIVQDASPLTPAQVEALPDIVNQVYLSGDHYDSQSDAGFLGIQTRAVDIASTKGAADDRNYKGILVLNRVPGFCGARALRNGDVIIGIADMPELGFIDPDSFRENIKQHHAGSTVRFQILRHGQVREVAVTLDPRPVIAEQEDLLLDMVQKRQHAFESYWQATFAPLLKEEISSADAATR